MLVGPPHDARGAVAMTTASTTSDSRWNFGLVYGGIWIGNNLNRLPSIRDFLVYLPYRADIVLAGVSILKGGAAIPRHHDEPPENRGSFRVVHFGLFGERVLHVNTSQYTMGPGVHLTFDDANDHAATNSPSTLPRGESRADALGTGVQVHVG